MTLVSHSIYTRIPAHILKRRHRVHRLNWYLMMFVMEGRTSSIDDSLEWANDKVCSVQLSRKLG